MTSFSNQTVLVKKDLNPQHSMAFSQEWRVDLKAGEWEKADGGARNSLKKKKKKKRGLRDDLVQSFHVTYLILQPREVTKLA